MSLSIHEPLCRHGKFDALHDLFDDGNIVRIRFVMSDTSQLSPTHGQRVSEQNGSSARQDGVLCQHQILNNAGDTCTLVFVPLLYGVLPRTKINPSLRCVSEGMADCSTELNS